MNRLEFQGKRLAGSDEETMRWDYSRCPGINIMRSVAQLVGVLALVGFQCTFVAENRWALRAAAVKAPAAPAVKSPLYAGSGGL